MAKENDIVLIYLESQPTTFARIESITADHKPGWYHVKLLVLQIPLQVVTWILRDAYINGDVFTMGGKEMRLEKIECPDVHPGEPEADKTDGEKPAAKKGKVISLTNRKEKH